MRRATITSALVVIVTFAMAHVSGAPHPASASPSILSTSCSTVTLAPPRTLAIGGEPVALKIADFNNDGIPDIVTANRFANSSVSVLQGLGGGSFAAAAELPMLLPPTGVVVADFNGDGALDLAVKSGDDSSPQGIVSIFLGTGTGSFGAPWTFAVSAGLGKLVAADFNGDGHPDLLVAAGITLTVWSGDGTGHFTMSNNIPLPGTTTASRQAPLAIAAGDFNGDGRMDVAVASMDFWTYAGDIDLYLADGSGGFAGPVSFAVGHQPTSIGTADLDGDGRLDLFSANVSDNTVSVLLSDPTLLFKPQRVYPVATEPGAIAAGDLNGDGHLDLAATDTDVVQVSPTVIYGAISILLNDGTGNFEPQQLLHTGAGPEGGLGLADLNADGRTDIAAGNRNSYVSVLLSTCGNVADISTSMTASAARAPLGAPATYTVSAANLGPDISGDVTLRTVLSPRPELISATPTQGTCKDVSAPAPADLTIACDLGQVAAAAPNNVANVKIVVVPATTPTLTATATSTADVDPNAANNTAAASTDTVSIGGLAVTISPTASGGVLLTWTQGALESGYFVGRRVGDTTTMFPSDGVPLPASVNQFTDTAPVAGQTNCYAIGAVDANGAGLARSNLVCLATLQATATNAPGNFTLQFGLTSVASLTWNTVPVADTYTLFAYGLDGQYLRSRWERGAVTSMTDDTTGVSTCYVVGASIGASALGHSAMLCALPGTWRLAP